MAPHTACSVNERDPKPQVHMEEVLARVSLESARAGRLHVALGVRGQEICVLEEQLHQEQM